MKQVFLTGAYGRKYKDFDAMRADWIAGKDFIYNGIAYCSIRNEAELCDKIGSIFFVIKNEYERA